MGKSVYEKIKRSQLRKRPRQTNLQAQYSEKMHQFAKAGDCPICKRNYVNLVKHVEDKHAGRQERPV